MRALVTAALCALALAGCGAGEDIRGGGTIPGSSMTVATLLPLGGPDAEAVRDIIAGQKLALHETGGKVAGFRVGFAVYDTAVRSPEKVGRAAIEDVQIGAVIGPVRSRAAAPIVPIVNAAGLLHVGLGAGDPAIASDERLRVSGEQTYFPLAADARDQATEMLGLALPGPVAVERENGRESRALARELVAAARDRLAEDPERARTVLYAGEDVETATRVAGSVARPGGARRIVFGDALVRRGLPGALPDRSRDAARFVATVPARPPAAFAEAFRELFGRDPGPYAVLGHTAMARVIDAVRRAGRRANHRQRIVDAYAEGPGAEPLRALAWPAP